MIAFYYNASGAIILDPAWMKLHIISDVDIVI